jgi:hypothetical protein
MDTPLTASDFSESSMDQLFPVEVELGSSHSGHPAADANVRTHVLTTEAARRMPNLAWHRGEESPARASASSVTAPSMLDGLLVQLVGPALVAAGLVRLLYRAEWSSVMSSPAMLGSTELWSAAAADFGAAGLLVALWVAAWRRAQHQEDARLSTGWDLAALLLFIPVLALSIPSIGLAAIGLSAMLTTFAALFGGVADFRDARDGHAPEKSTGRVGEGRWGEAAFASLQVLMVAAGLAAGGTSQAAATALCAAALVGAMAACTLGRAEEAEAAH